MSEHVLILGRASSINVRKVLWTCDEAGLPYTRQDASAEELAALNPNALMPVVRVAGRVIWESNTICRCLAGIAGRDDLLPRAPLERAAVETWMDWQATELNPAWRDAFMGLVRRAPAFQDPARIAAGAREWNARMAMLDAQLDRTGAYVAGPGFTLADILLGVSTNRWLMTPIERPRLPAIEAWLERLAVRPGFLSHARNGIP
ncbi:glutathione S-transferase [Rhodovarius crocodyli]|uniref:Glutathione S-transferase n=1 Tax=Rhodovarius crocodyli TaxID=1979269 RepID=A0A437MCR1_9PROT|nr:glutathione S-transferase N-terminal domain-containing protein [Rhodovarius crocodyli]RVT95353.1 glutathione S-transferase [Rhodovarius crocodyli]